MQNILIIDDDEQVCILLSKLFSNMGLNPEYRLTLGTGLAHIPNIQPEVLFLDVNLPDGNGLDAIETIRQFPNAPEIIIITADENADGAEIAMHSKAWDYISKQGSYKNFKFALNRALEYRKQKQKNLQTRPIQRKQIIGSSQPISLCIDQVSKAADSELPVLITGETGTGKELFSKAIHDNSTRKAREFVVVDCAALPEHLVESTLFGHTKGAFTGADGPKTGLMAMADKGTLFLDEVGELPQTIQKKFLRALQEKKFRPIGSKTELKSDFRLVCATHRDLAAMVHQKTFREDLYFRLFSMVIHLPPLKDRGDDIKSLSTYHLARKGKITSSPPCAMPKEFLRELECYEWPGNVRELINTLDLVCSEAGPGTLLYPHHLPGHIRAFNIRHRIGSREKKPPIPEPPTSFPHGIQPFKTHMDETKAAYLENLLAVSQGNIKDACQHSGLSRGHLYRLLQQFNLK